MKTIRRHSPAALLAIALALSFGQARAEAPAAAKNAASTSQPERYQVPVPDVKPFTPNTMMDPITPEARRKFVQSSLALSPLSVRDMINLLAYKVEARPGLSYEDVVSSMKQRANKINFKFVGVNSIYKDIAAISGKPTPKVEIYNFCDAVVARELLDYSLEFVIFLPCRIAVVEDANQKVWLTMLDWDVSWIDTAPNPNKLPDSIYKAADKLRKGIEEIIQAGASGSL